MIQSLDISSIRYHEMDDQSRKSIKDKAAEDVRGHARLKKYYDGTTLVDITSRRWVAVMQPHNHQSQQGSR
jgi:hypothetical protein